MFLGSEGSWRRGTHKHLVYQLAVFKSAYNGPGDEIAPAAVAMDEDGHPVEDAPLIPAPAVEDDDNEPTLTELLLREFLVATLKPYHYYTIPVTDGEHSRTNLHL